MPATNVIGLSENISTMTLDEGLAFVARMRRQLDRFDIATPGMQGKRFPAEYAERIQNILNELEADIRGKQEGI